MITEIKDTPVPIKIWAKDLEDTALIQAKETAHVPKVFHHLALMADAHAGKGSTVGSVIALEGALMPSAVGVDIGCGVRLVRLPFSINDVTDLKKLRHSFERSVPLGRQGNYDISQRVGEVFNSLGLPQIYQQHNKEMYRAALQLGSLGGGNHFIELCYDDSQQAYLLLHTGSRHIGLIIAEKYIDLAVKVKQVDVPNSLLSCLLEGTSQFDNYLYDLNWALQYAKYNREEIMLRLIKDISYHVYGDNRLSNELTKMFVVDCHHNFAARETHFGKSVWIIRKGAIRARKGEFGVIPGSMGTPSYIIQGKGNVDSFESCSHGAGRKMSRSKAGKTLTEDDVLKQTYGVECRKDIGIIDEIPGAYKDIEEVMSCQADLITSVAKLKQVLCVKGGKE